MIARLALVAALVAALASPARAQETVLPGECVIDEAATVDVLLLVDQSGSLAGTDPAGRRVTGAQSVVRSYSTLAERVARVRVQVAGFGAGFEGRGWQVLDEGTRGDLIEQVATVGAEESDFHTDYVFAVDGARRAFEESEADCRILFWFTDGAHDLDSDLLQDGLERFYHPDPVTPGNVDEVEALMPGLVCDSGGLADQLGSLGVSTQVMLLGSGEAMGEASARVLRGMGGDPGFECGPGNGSFEDVASADELPFRMMCAAHPGALEVAVDPVGGTLLLNDQAIAAGGINPALVTDLSVIARGAPGSPPAVGATTLEGITEIADDASGTVETTLAPTGQSFEVELTGVEDACAFATAAPPVPVVTALTPTLYQGEPGEFTVVLDGPHGRLAGDSLAGIEVTASQGTVAAGDEGWTVTVSELPAATSFELTATATAAPLSPATGTAGFALNEQLNAPRVTGQPDRVIGEGPGPFQVPLEIDGQDGGTLCLDARGQAMTTANDEPIGVAATFDGEECIEVPAGAGQTYTLDVTPDRQAFVVGVLELAYRSIPAARPDRQEAGALAVDLELTPVANTALVSAAVAGLLLLLGGLLWGTLYGVNRLVSRIPDPRRHGVRFADFTADIRPDEYGDYKVVLAEAPTDRDLRAPRHTPSELRAGRLALVRKVPLLPWRAPHAELSAGSDVVVADLGSGVMQRTVLGDGSVHARPSDGLGPIVALSISAASRARLDDGTPQKVPGVLLMNVKTAKGLDATAVTRDLIETSLDRIATEFAVSDDMTKERTPRT
jgi:hypothetical protein